MRKTALLLFLACLSLILCNTRAGSGEEKIRIGFSTSSLDDTFLNYVVEAARGAAKEHDVDLIVEGARESIDVQNSQVTAMIAEGVSAIVVVITDTSMPAEVVEAAKKAGIPLVFVNRNPYPGERPPENCFVIATDAFVEGETQMRFAGGLIGADGHLFILQGLPTNDGAQKRTAGVKSVVQSTYPELAIVAEETANWMRGQARGIVNKWIDSFERIDAIVANNDDMALGALDALRERNRKDVVVVGVDAIPEALQAIADGAMAGTVLQDPIEQGRRAITVALRAIRKEPQTQNLLLPSELVTKDNIADYLTK